MIFGVSGGKFATRGGKFVSCGCCGCCPYAYRELKPLNAIDGIIRFKWSGEGESFAGTGFVYDESINKWTTPEFCNGEAYTLRFWCSDEQWLFDLISSRDGVNYAVPASPGTPGGATLLSCEPFDLYAEITSPGIYADDFPFCDKSGTFPGGDLLEYFNFTAFE